MLSLNYQMVLFQCQVFKIIWKITNKHYKETQTFSNNSPIYICINRINNRLLFKIKDGYKLELQMPEILMKLLRRTKKLIKKQQKVIKMYLVLK